MNKLYNTKVISRETGIKHRSVVRQVQNYEEDLKEIGEIKEDIVKLESGQYEKRYNLNKGQFSYLISRMKRKANVSKVINKYDLNCYYIKNRLENTLFYILKSVVDGFDNNLILEQDYYIDSYRVDYALFIGTKEIKNLWLVIEYDECQHKYNIKADSLREKSILNYANNIEPEIKELYIIRIKEGEEMGGISMVVRYLNSSMLNLSPSNHDSLEQYKEIKESLLPIFKEIG